MFGMVIQVINISVFQEFDYVAERISVEIHAKIAGKMLVSQEWLFFQIPAI